MESTLEFELQPHPPKDSLMSAPTGRPPSKQARTVTKESTQDEQPEFQFRYQNGSKLHNFSQKEVPYPLSYDRDILDLWAIDHALIQTVKHGQLTLRDFKNDVPKRVLDLGTALGDWVLACAGKWTESTFVGFDVVDIQIPLEYVEPSVARRVQWVRGNFLTAGLPFPDNEFDYVHMQGIAFAIPEFRWHDFLDEVYRVLKPGGTVEILQEDATFPVLPKWFTRPLHTDRSSSYSPPISGSSTPLLPNVTTSDDQPHDHTLLEYLFNAVFESRFINPRPSSILPVYFASTFRHVKSPPLLYFPMPPIAPLTPLPGLPNTQSITPDTITCDPDNPYSFFLPVPRSPTMHEECQPSSSSGFTSDVSFDFSRPVSPHATQSARTSISSTTPTSLERRPSAYSLRSEPSISAKKPQYPSTALLSPMAESNMIGGDTSAVIELFPLPELHNLEEKVLYMHLYRAVGVVYGTKEYMWDELEKLIAREDPLLKLHGWRDDDFGNRQLNRRRFEVIFQRYKDDMHARLSLWHSLTQTAGWVYPKREPLTAPELSEEQRLRQMILEARKHATAEDFESPCRTIRLLIGVKG